MLNLLPGPEDVNTKMQPVQDCVAVVQISPMSIAERLERIRRSKRLSYKEVARRTGKGDSQVSRWFRGENVPGMENLSRIAEALGVSVADITDLPADHDCWTHLGLTEAHRSVCRIHDFLVELGLQPQLDALVLGILRASGKVSDAELQEFERSLLGAA